MPRPFLTAEWRKLIMAQYEVPPATLARWLPAGLELDLYRDPAAPDRPRCYVSLVGFLFDDVRVLGLKLPRHTTFPEVNLRFYVKRTAPGEETARRGVVFLSEIVPRCAITAVARTIYKEPYETRPMRHRITLSPEALGVSYQFDYKKIPQTIAATADPTPHTIAPGSLEEFITEHYFGYTRRRGRTAEYAVQHPRWTTYSSLRHYIRVDFTALYGPEFAQLNPAQPDHLLLAEGSDVSVFPGRRLPAL